jgi:hypothetical protein
MNCTLWDQFQRQEHNVCQSAKWHLPHYRHEVIGSACEITQVLRAIKKSRFQPNESLLHNLNRLKPHYTPANRDKNVQIPLFPPKPDT